MPFLFKKKILLSIIVFSILENILLFFNLRTRSVLFVGVSPVIKYLIVFIWPILNIFLLYKYFFSRKK